MSERSPEPDGISAIPGRRAHAPTVGPGRQHDGRSVGELLRDADHQARTLLLDLGADDAPALLRNWPQLVHAATGAWAAVSDVATRSDTRTASRAAAAAQHLPPAGDTDPMLRLQAVTDGIAATLVTARWPGHGPGSPTVEEIAGNLHRVTHRLENHGADLPLQRPDVRADIAAAQMRLMHTVYLVAHATTSSLQQHGRRLHHDTNRDRRPLPLATTGLPYAVGPTNRWVQRVGVCEGIAGRYVRGTDGGFAAATAGEVILRPEDPGRLHHELARWDIQVHRSLAADSSPHDLVIASRTQAFIAATALPLLTTAQQAGLGTDGDLQPLTAAVETSGMAWSQLASRWADLAPAGSRADRDLTRAAAQLRAAAREITHSSEGKATAADILERVDLARALDSIQHALAAAVDVAHLACDPAANPNLTGPARPLSIRAHNDTEKTNETRLRHEREQDVVWVTPQDVLRNRSVPLPRPVAEGLERASSAVVAASQRAAACWRIEASDPGAAPPLVTPVRPPAAQHRHQDPPRHEVGRAPGI